MASASVLAGKCKSSWSGPGCNPHEIQLLSDYVLYYCGDFPDTHVRNQRLFAQYVNSPMLNSAFLRSWAWLSVHLDWPLCVVCFLNYPYHSSWEKNISHCRE